MKTHGKFFMGIPERKARSVRADAVNIVAWPTRINDGDFYKVERTDSYLMECYFEWYCPVCKRHHWAVESGLGHIGELHQLYVVLDCADTTVVFPWSENRKLDKTSIYGQTMDSLKKHYNPPDNIGKPVVSCWKVTP